MNNLSLRLKYAKRELTALKTAHPRGLGNLRVYRRRETMTSPDVPRGTYDITIVLTFGDSYAPYPFVNVLAGPEVDGVTLYGFEEFEYIDNGRKAKVFGYAYFYQPLVTVEYEVLSMAPVTNIQVTWEDH